MRKPFFYLFLAVFTILVLEAIGYLALFFSSREFDFLSNKNYFFVRAMLMGNTDPEMLPRYLTVPYLGYVPYPGYKRNGIVQHNEDGYRGSKVHMNKGRGLRVLCLGGSTTYGTGVLTPAETYPANLEHLLTLYIQQDSSLRLKYGSAEVINGGLEAGTSAEELAQYVFKYRYYKPDVVVIHSAINDALVYASTANGFQLDYTHYRRLNYHLEPLPNPARFFMKSYLFSFLTIKLFYSNFSVIQDEFMRQNDTVFPHWTEVNIDSVFAQQNYTMYPYYRNTETLLSELAADSVSTFILPGTLNRSSGFVKSNDKYSGYVDFNNNAAKRLSVGYKAYFVDFNYDSISQSGYWIDDCHLNREGEMEKANVVFNAVKLWLQKR